MLIRLEIVLSDEDRAIWRELSLATARHPSETEVYLATRLLAWCLRWEEGLELSTGVSAGSEPAASARELDGRLKTWIEVGLPEPERLHKAAKRVERLSVFPHRSSVAWRDRCRAARVHRADAIEVVEIELPFLEWVAAGLGGRSRWDVWVEGGEVRLAIDGDERATRPTVSMLAG